MVHNISHKWMLLLHIILTEGLSDTLRTFLNTLIPTDVFIPANRCGPVPVIGHGMPNTTLVDQDTVVGYECEEGYWFPPGHTPVAVRCDKEEWTGNLQHCTGEVTLRLCKQRYYFLL